MQERKHKNVFGYLPSKVVELPYHLLHLNLITTGRNRGGNETSKKRGIKSCIKAGDARKILNSEKRSKKLGSL